MNRSRSSLEETHVAAKILLRMLVNNRNEKQIKVILKLIEGKEFTTALALLIHHLEFELD